MRVYAFESNKKGFMELENTLKAEQAFVGGLIEVVAITEDIDLVLNEEGLLLDLEPMVSLKLEENRSIVLQYLMGHSDISVTLGIYTHANADMAKEEVERLKKEGINL